LVRADRLAVFDLFVALASKSFIYSGTFWGPVGGIAALAALVLGVPALWLTWRQANPKRRLLRDAGGGPAAERAWPGPPPGGPL
jgi:hypothetical protein